MSYSPPPLHNPSLSIIIPIRNEAGNIPRIFDTLPASLKKLSHTKIEFIFVEGNSSDNTWDVVQRYTEQPIEGISVSAFQQPGRGKADAVRHGIQRANYDLVVIFDADLTVDPSYIPTFYSAYTNGRGAFINGDRLTLPSESKAMRPLNRLGNIFFARLMSWILQTEIRDALCGTKLFSRKDWLFWQEWRKRTLQNIDPFGDFELLFSAAFFGAKIHNIPLRYKARRYGTTNIHRFRDGATLLRIALRGFWHVRIRPSRVWPPLNE